MSPPEACEGRDQEPDTAQHSPLAYGGVEIPQIPWNIDISPRATRRRGIAFFHAVVVLMSGGLGLAWHSPWLILVWLISMGWTVRRHMPISVGAVVRLGNQMTELYAAINRANAEADRGQRGGGCTSAPTPEGPPPPQTAERS